MTKHKINNQYAVVKPFKNSFSLLYQLSSVAFATNYILMALKENLVSLPLKVDYSPVQTSHYIVGFKSLLTKMIAKFGFSS